MQPLADYRAVLSRYPAAGLTWHESAGGFSGAAIWRGELNDQPALCLKAWPTGYPAERLAQIHRWMQQAHAARLAFVPAVVPTLTGETWVEHAGRIWDVTAWRPGVADFHAAPSDARLAAACAALAALHRVWQPTVPQFAPCPAVLRRLTLFAEYEASEPLVSDAIAALRPWAERPVPVLPCLCDVWHDHVLFTDDNVTGVIDYGAMKLDHPAADLARLLGDLVDGEPERVRFGLAAYHAAGAPLTVDAELVALLDRTGVIGGVLHWMRRMETGEKLTAAATRRFTRLKTRLAVISKRRSD